MFLDPVTGETTYEECPPYERLEWDAPDGTRWLWSAAYAAWAGWVPGEDRVLVLSATEMDKVYPEWPRARRRVHSGNRPKSSQSDRRLIRPGQYLVQDVG